MICRRCHRYSDERQIASQDNTQDDIQGNIQDNNDNVKSGYCPYCGKSFTDDSEIEVDNPDLKPREDDDGSNNIGNGIYKNAGSKPYTMPPPRVNIPPYIPPVEREMTPARKFFSALAHAAIYYLLFLLIQFIVSTIYSSVIMYGAMSDFMTDYYASYDLEGVTITDELYSRLTEELQGELEVIVAEAMEKIDYNLIGIISSVATLFILFLLFKTRQRSFTHEVGLNKINILKALPTLPAAVAMQFLVVFLLNLIPFPQDIIDSYEQMYAFIGTDNIWIEIIGVVILAPITEEIVFRGCVYSRLRRGMSALPATLICAVSFGIAHGHIISIAYATLMGIILCALYEKFDSILVPMLFHLGFNSANYIPLMRESSSDTTIFITVAVSAAVFAAALLYAIKCKPSRAKPEISGNNIDNNEIK